jgi:hypothetical protein
MKKPARKKSGIAQTGNGKKKPNNLVIRGDETGQNNSSCYSYSPLGYKTPDSMNSFNSTSRLFDL